MVVSPSGSPASAAILTQASHMMGGVLREAPAFAGETPGVGAVFGGQRAHAAAIGFAAPAGQTTLSFPAGVLAGQTGGDFLKASQPPLHFDLRHGNALSHFDAAKDQRPLSVVGRPEHHGGRAGFAHHRFTPEELADRGGSDPARRHCAHRQVRPQHGIPARENARQIRGQGPFVGGDPPAGDSQTLRFGQRTVHRLADSCDHR
jgi:hypothetical protein